ncbi:MAG: hypothetical protein AAFX85_07185 [Pseudomonadota bacterium]
MPLLRCLLVSCLAGLPLIAFGADNVTISVTSTPPRPALARAGDQALSVVTLLGETVTLMLTKGRTYTLLGAGGLGGARFDTLPREGEVLRMTPEADDDGEGYRLRVEVRRWQAESEQHFTSTVSVLPDEWTRVWGEQPVEAGKVKRFASAPASRSLFVKVQR